MKIKQTILLGALLIGVSSLFASNLSFAAAGDACGNKILKEGQSCCAGIVTSVLSCTGGTEETTDIQQTGLWRLLLLIINILTAGIGVMAVGGIVYGSVLYTSSGGSADQAKKGMEIITNVVIGLVAYALMYSFLNFIIPGGLFA